MRIKIFDPNVLRLINNTYDILINKQELVLSELDKKRILKITSKYYFEVFPINRLSIINHLETLKLLQPIFSLQQSKVIFETIINTITIYNLSIIETTIFKEVFNILGYIEKQLTENIFNKVYEDIIKNDEFLKLLDWVYDIFDENRIIKEYKIFIIGTMTKNIAYTIMLLKYFSIENDTHENDLIKRKICEDRIQKLTYYNRGYSPYKMATCLKIIATKLHILKDVPYIQFYITLLHKKSILYLEESYGVEVILEMCNKHINSDWMLLVELLSQRMKCLIKNYIIYTIRHETTNPDSDDESLEYYKKLKVNSVIYKNSRILFQLLKDVICSPIKENEDICYEDHFSFQSYEYLKRKEGETNSCKELYGISTDSFKFSKFYCPSCVHSYKEVCDSIISKCSRGKTLEENKLIYNTIKKCIELRQQYEEACIEKQDTNHHTEIVNRINGILNCQNVFDFLLGKIN